ncbi:MAG: hypothetical protein ABI743_03365, partial [bacterium]
DADFGGGTRTSQGAADGYVVRFDAAGLYTWDKQFGSGGFDRGFAVTVDNGGNVYAAGRYGGNVDFGGGQRPVNGGTDGYCVKFNSAGGWTWDYTWGGLGDEFGEGLGLDNGGDLRVIGYFAQMVDFEPGAEVTTITSVGGVDSSVVKLNSGSGLW